MKHGELVTIFRFIQPALFHAPRLFGVQCISGCDDLVGLNPNDSSDDDAWLALAVLPCLVD